MKDLHSNRAKQHITKIIGISVSLTILVILYVKVDFISLKDVFSKFSYFYFSLILLSFMVIYFLLAWRWKVMAQPYCCLTYLESVKHIAFSNTLNIILPSKMGSFAKAYFMIKRGHNNTKSAISMVIYEKLSDLAAMSLVFIIAAIINYKFNALIILTLFASWFLLLCYASLHVVNILNNSFVNNIRRIKIVNKIMEMVEVVYIFNNNPNITKTYLVKINFITLILWLVYTTQLVLFFSLLDLKVSIFEITTYMLSAIFVGLLPITIAGLGARDIAIVYLFRDIITYSEAISIGIICNIRNIIYAMIGLPFFVFMLSEKDSIFVREKCKNVRDIRYTSQQLK